MIFYKVAESVNSYCGEYHILAGRYPTFAAATQACRHHPDRMKIVECEQIVGDNYSIRRVLNVDGTVIPNNTTWV